MINKYLHRLGFKMTNEFLKRNNFYKYSCGDGLVSIVTMIKSYANEVLGKEWLAGNVLKLPHMLNSMNPVGLLLREDVFHEGVVEFYCHKDLPDSEIDRMLYLIKSSIEEFIEKHREALKQYRPDVDIDNINTNLQRLGMVDFNFLCQNLSLAKVLFLRELANESIYIGSSDNDKYIQEGKAIKFYPCYSKQSGHMLISEIINIDTAGKTEQMAYYITPNIEEVEGELYIYPLVGIKRIVTSKKMNSIQYGTAQSYSTLVFDGSTYHTPRIAYRPSKNSNIKEISLIQEDWKLYKYLEEYKGISFEDIKSHINGEDKPNIYLIHSNKMGTRHRLGSGVPGCDKLDIYNHVLSNIKGLEGIEPIIEQKLEKTKSALSNTEKIKLPNTIYRSEKTELELLVIHPTSSNLYHEIVEVLEDGKLIEDNTGIISTNFGSYSFETGDGKKINLTVKSIPSIVGLEIKADHETYQERLSKLISEIGIKSSNKLTLAFVELPNMGKYDAKALIRQALDSHGVINQFIDSNTGINTNKITSGLRDLLNDIGLGNRNQSIKSNGVIYTIHKACKIPFICRLDNESVEMKVPGVINKYLHVTDIYSSLPYIRNEITKTDELDKLAIATFIEDIEQEKRVVITILEEGETLYNTIIKGISDEQIEKIKFFSKQYVTTDLLGHQEVIQTKNEKITLGVGLYNIKEGTYISIGDKGHDKTTVEASKIRSWYNKYQRVSIGATIPYKDRIAYQIQIHNKQDNEEISQLIHRLRLAITTHSHLNRCITTDYILGLEKHLK